VARTKSALITGITGQDGSYLAEQLLEKGYAVFGLVRRLSTPNLGRIQHILNDLTVLEGDLTDSTSLIHAVKTSAPDEVYNLAAQSFVGTSWTQPVMTCDVSGIGVVRLLEAVRQIAPDARFYQASSSEMFGQVEESPQNERTRFHPRSPYGFAKVLAHHAVVNYRESYDMFAASGICFNHESPRRGLEFVTRKISHGAALIAAGKQKEIHLGNLDAKRDWGFAGDFVDAMWRMLQQKEPEDYVVATGKAHSVRDFCRAAFKEAGLPKWEKYVVVDKRYMRPAEVHTLCGDAGRARKALKWAPKVDFEGLVKMMVKSDLEIVGAKRQK
jgi:GDPmannose 4,6-dehydratase